MGSIPIQEGESARGRDIPKVSAHSEVAQSLSSLPGLIPLRPAALCKHSFQFLCLFLCVLLSFTCWVCFCVLCSTSCFRQTSYSLIILGNLYLREGQKGKEAKNGTKTCDKAAEGSRRKVPTCLEMLSCSRPEQSRKVQVCGRENACTWQSPNQPGSS